MHPATTLAFDAQSLIAQAGLEDPELFEYVFGGDNTLLALSFVLNIALAGLTILGIVYLGRNLTDPRAKLIAIALMLISVVSISSYTGLTSALTLGVVEMPAGHPAAGSTTAGEDGVLTMWGRYLTWTFSTPFILIALGLIAGSDWVKILTTCAFTIAMCVTGLAAALTTSSLLLRWWWFVLGTMFFLVIVYVILVDWTAEAATTGTGDLFRTLKILTVVGWFGYPILWALGVEGFALLDVTVTSWGYSILDIITKYIVTFVAMAYIVDEPASITGGPDYGASLRRPASGDD
ncbi:bacteriorhodopsin [Natronobiforma cellulositropha]|uniref:bacteriorhodopsin n=1 Tax=Natronobiforma cellulositropha TaxID=1679076 RepID=UPI0021D5DE62|nr:bacteriorhodopsin [Natronobiforma cellulositropha]